MLVGVLNGGVGCLHCLLREWDIAARDGVQIRLAGVLGLHGKISLAVWTLSRRGGPFPQFVAVPDAERPNPLFSIRRIYSSTPAENVFN